MRQHFMRALTSFGLGLGLLFAGCDEGTEDPDAGDASDAGPGLDAGGRDAGPPVDGGGEVDAGSAVDAGPEPCASPGAVETIACGMCGTLDRFCSSAGFWANGACEDEGECAPGATRAEGTCGNCGTQEEICNASCAWEPSAACTDEGVCTPGTRTRSGEGCPSGQTREVICDDACGYVPDGDCEDDSCPSPGAVEDVPCGNCGTRERFCTAEGVWSYGICEAEGVCAPGSTDDEACGMCGTQALRCTTACAWEPFETCTGEGACAPGETRRTDAGCAAGQSRELTCSAACAFEPGVCMLDECVPGAIETMPCGMCGTRTRTCGDDRRWADGACSDEGMCMPGTSGSQPCGMCGTQETRCDVDCNWQPFGVCTGGGVCVPSSMSSCPTSCLTTGTQTCTASCTLGACVPPAETCNGVNDDCDASVDEGCVGCGPCAGSTEVTGTGGRFRVALQPHVRTGSCGGAGSEAMLSLNLTVASDVFISTHQGTVDTVVYLRNCSCSGTELGCNDDANGLTTSMLRLRNLAPGHYTIVVDTKAASTATIPVDVNVTPTAVAGDRCGDPTHIAAGSTTLTGATCGLTNDYDIVTDAADCPAALGGDGPEHVYYFHVPTRRTLTFAACGPATTYDTTLYVRAACTGALLANQVACDDDGCADTAVTCEGYRSSLTTTLDPGLYYLVVDGYVFGSPPPCAACGTFSLAISGL